MIHKPEKPACLDLAESASGPVHNPNLYAIKPGTAFPTRLNVETSQACALACPHCRRTLEDNRAGDTMSAATAAALEPLLKKIDIICLAGWGETFSGPQAFNLVRTARKHEVYIAAATNGTLLNEATCRQLLDCELPCVSVSLDAGTEAGYRRLRPGGPALEQIARNVRRLIAMRDRENRRFPSVVSSFNFHDASAPELSPYLKLVADLGIEHVTIQILLDMSFGRRGLPVNLSQRARALFDEGMELAGRLNLPVEVNLPEILKMQFEAQARNERNDIYLPSLETIRRESLFPACACFWDGPFVDIHGNLYPCNVYPVPLGNMLEEGFQNVWHGERAVALRRGLVTGDPPAACLRCRQTVWYRNSLADSPGSAMTMETLGLKGMGWYDAEPLEEGLAFRWARPEADLWLRNNGAREAWIVARALGETTIRLRLDGETVGEQRLGSEWAMLRYATPRSDGSLAKLGFESTRPVRDPAMLHAPHSCRHLGMAVVGVGLGEPELGLDLLRRVAGPPAAEPAPSLLRRLRRRAGAAASSLLRAPRRQ